MRYFFNFRRDTIAAKLLTRVFYFYIIVAISVTLMHMLAEYTTTKNDTKTDLEIFHGTFEPGLAIALWNQEDFGLKASLIAMLKVPQISGAKVLDEEGRQIGAIGEILDDNGNHVIYDENGLTKETNALSSLFWKSNNIHYYDEETYLVGKLILYSSSKFVFERVQDGYLFIIINSIIKTLALWIIVLTLSGPMLTEPLKKLSKSLKSRTLDNLDDFKFDMKFTNSFEFQLLEKGFNNLLKNLSNSMKERKEAEHDIINLNCTLESKVKSRTEKLNLANIQLKKSLDEIELAQNKLIESEKMAALGELVAGVAHEINTPIGVSLTASSYLQGEIRSVEKSYNDNQITHSQMSRFIQVCQESCDITLSNLERASFLINNFKKIAVEQNIDELETFDIVERISEFIHILKPALKKGSHNINIHGDEEVIIKSYSSSLYQIISNLILNSVIHAFENKSNGLIDIIVKRRGEKLELLYSDNGKGMNDTEKDKIFTPFFTTKRGKGGSGLGAHIMYNIVTQKMHGSIKCESALEQGTNFTIIIPVNLNSH